MTTYDTTAIRESVNLLDLVGRDTSLHKVSGTGGLAGLGAARLGRRGKAR